MFIWFFSFIQQCLQTCYDRQAWENAVKRFLQGLNRMKRVGVEPRSCRLRSRMKRRSRLLGRATNILIKEFTSFKIKTNRNSYKRDCIVDLRTKFLIAKKLNFFFVKCYLNPLQMSVSLFTP